MARTTAAVSDAESILPDSVRGEMWTMRDVLDCESLGFTVLALEAGEETMSHNHADENVEEVYYVSQGGVDVDFDGRTVSLEDGEAVRISPEEDRRIQNRDQFSQLVLVSAPVGE